MADEQTELSFGERLHAAMAELEWIEKKGYNRHFNYAFVQEADVKAAVSKALRKHGLLLAQVEYTPVGECTGKAATLKCEVTIRDVGLVDGNVYFQGIGAGTDSSDKAPMKACAAALKYALTSGFLIATGDDPEEDGGTAGKAQGKTGTSKPANSNAGAVEVDISAIEKAIASAKSTAELNKVKPKLAALRGSDSYTELAAAFVAQGKALTAEAA